MNDDEAGTEPGVPEALLNWIAAGRPEPAPAEVKRWLAESGASERDVDSLVRLWDVTAPAEPADGGFADIRARIRQTEDTAPVRSRRRPHGAANWFVRAAAAVVLLAGGALAGSQLADRVFEARGAIARIDVPAGANAELQLPGGIAVHLNAGSSLSYPAGRGGVEEATLEGEGFFSVPHDPDREFVVHTAAGVIRDIGTEFAVRARDSVVSVVVTEGVVALEAAGASVEVRAGETSSAALGSAPAAAAPADIEAAVAWMEGRLLYTDEPIGSIAEDLTRTFGMSVAVSPALQDTRVTAQVSTASDLEDAVRLIALAASARYERSATGWLITTR